MRYEIKGTPFPVVICQLEDGEQMVTERGSMVWMSPNMEMQTHGGGLGRMFSKMFSGESMFQNIYTAHGAGMIAFGSSFPGQIKEIAITPGHDMILQKSAFLAAVPGVELSIHFNQRLGAGLFGGEGFIMQRLSGSGMAFAEIDGTLVEYDLQPGQQHVPHEAALRLGHERQSGDERLRTAQARHQQVFRMVAERQRPERRLDQLPDRPAIVRPLLPYRQFHAGFVCTDPGQAAPDAPRKPAAHRTPPPGVSVSCRI